MLLLKSRPQSSKNQPTMFHFICWPYFLCFYYVDMSAIPKNRQLVFSIRNYIGDASEIFSISSLVKISLTSFLCFSSIFFYFQNTRIYVIKRKLLVGLNIWSLSSSEIFFPFEDMLQMFASPCNILCISKCQTMDHLWRYFKRESKVSHSICTLCTLLVKSAHK